MTMPAKMRGAVRSAGRLVLRADLPAPRPEPGEVLVRVAACQIGRGDLRDAPAAVPGCGFCGRVVAVGEEVPAWRLGDRVVVDPGFPSSGDHPAHLGFERDGGLAELVAVPAWDAVTVGSEALTDEALALLPAYYGRAELVLTWGRLHAGETALVLGADQGSGPAAMELARVRGATVLTGAADAPLPKVDLVADFRLPGAARSDIPHGLEVTVAGWVRRAGAAAVRATDNPDVFTLRFLELLVRAAAAGAVHPRPSRIVRLEEAPALFAGAASSPADDAVVVTLSGG